MSLTRRDLLRLAGAATAGAALPTLPACGPDPGPDYVYDGPPADRQRFAHGVASGDPLSDSVVLWTRVDLGDQAELPVYVEVHTDEALSDRVAAVTTVATAERDGCVKIDVTGLRPGKTWFYRFRCQDQASDVARTRTAPARGTAPLRLGVASCSNLTAGFFHAYGFLAEQDVHLIVHLGDYLYEYAGGRVRTHEPDAEIVTLADYRARYAQYRTDPDLREAHRQHPWILTWDDHESANNSWTGGAQNHQPDTEGPWSERLQAARQAWFEWLPVREGTEGHIYRQLQWGGLVELLVLDTRITGRDKQSRSSEELEDPARQLLGAVQEAWLIERIGASTARWVVLCQQVVMAPWSPEGAPPLNDDAWDGYPAARRRVLEAAAQRDGLVVLTGDVHSSWANDLALSSQAYDAGEVVGVEVVTPGITSSGADLGPALEVLLDLNPHIHWAETTRRGCVVLTLEREQVTAAWWHLDEADLDAVDTRRPTLAMTLRSARTAPGWSA